MARFSHDDDDDDDDAFDERGILRDGKTYRTPMYMMDALQRDIAMSAAHVTDGAGGTTGLHRPGFRLGLGDASAGDARQQAYDAYERDLTSAWRDPVGDGTKPDRVALPTIDARTDAYAQYDLEISQQWKGPSR